MPMHTHTRTHLSFTMCRVITGITLSAWNPLEECDWLELLPTISKVPNTNDSFKRRNKPRPNCLIHAQNAMALNTDTKAKMQEDEVAVWDAFFKIQHTTTS